MLTDKINNMVADYFALIFCCTPDTLATHWLIISQMPGSARHHTCSLNYLLAAL